MTGGSDPWYMKRVVDYIVAEHAHFIFDADRAYPSGGINPRPPLFSWCLALGGLALEWLTGITADEARLVVSCRSASNLRSIDCSTGCRYCKPPSQRTGGDICCLAYGTNAWSH